MKKFGSAMEKSRIRDKHPGSATLALMSEKMLRADTGLLNSDNEKSSTVVFIYREKLTLKM
jgi:hypothetical protein